jgi:hypothetical protein
MQHQQELGSGDNPLQTKGGRLAFQQQFHILKNQALGIFQSQERPFT